MRSYFYICLTKSLALPSATTQQPASSSQPLSNGPVLLVSTCIVVHGTSAVTKGWFGCLRRLGLFRPREQARVDQVLGRGDEHLLNCVGATRGVAELLSELHGPVPAAGHEECAYRVRAQLAGCQLYQRGDRARAKRACYSALCFHSLCGLAKPPPSLPRVRSCVGARSETRESGQGVCIAAPADGQRDCLLRRRHTPERRRRAVSGPRRRFIPSSGRSAANRLRRAFASSPSHRADRGGVRRSRRAERHGAWVEAGGSLRSRALRVDQDWSDAGRAGPSPWGMCGGDGGAQLHAQLENGWELLHIVQWVHVRTSARAVGACGAPFPVRINALGDDLDSDLQDLLQRAHERERPALRRAGRAQIKQDMCARDVCSAVRQRL